MNKNVYVTIKIKEGTVLPKGGNGHILVYDKENDSYYSVSLSDVFKNEREICDDILRKEEQFENNVMAKMREMDVKYENFLKTYKESNAKIIGLVESLIGEGDK